MQRRQDHVPGFPSRYSSSEIFPRKSLSEAKLVGGVVTCRNTVRTFWPIRNSGTDDVVRSVYRIEVRAGTCLADVSREGTVGLVGRDIGSLMLKGKVVVALWVFGEDRIVTEGC